MKILGTGSYLPNRVVSNDDLSKIVDTNDEWISSRTGIKERRISEGEFTSDLGAKASLIAIGDAGLKPEDIDLIIFATMTPDQVMPNTAAMTQAKIGAVNATCFDVSAACSGFLFALNTANAYLLSGMYQNILVVGAETLSRIIDWNDRSTCVLFGDGAGAVVVTADNTKKYVSVTGTDGAKGDVLTAGKLPLSNFIMKNDISSAVSRSEYFMAMNGQEVFKFAVTKVPECIKKLMEKADVTLEEIDYFLLHQANERIIASISKRLKVDIEKMPVNLHNYANTSAATIPILMDEFNRSSKLKEGMKLVLSGFGGGLTWGAVYLEV